MSVRSRERVMRTVPERECCGILPDVHSYWPRSQKGQKWYLKCPKCTLETRILADTEKEAVKYWEDEEVC